jgi:predicted aldo/keto reductase-like oxidoreductase
MADQGINRREFIRNTAMVAGCAAAGLGGNFLAQAADSADIKKTRSHNPEMEYRRLGNTGLWVSAVCLGGHWKRVAEVTGKKIPPYGPPKDPELKKILCKNRYDVLTRCMEKGINYVDACTMGEISVYGPALKGRRDKMYMGFAMWPHCPRNAKYRTAKSILDKLDEGLKTAKVEYVDVWRLVTGGGKNGHSEAEELEFIKAFETAKKQGKARFTGVSSHSRSWLNRLAQTYPKHFQVVLFPYSAQTKERPTDSLFKSVRKFDIGTFGIKPFGSNSLFKGVKTPEEKAARARLTIRYILSNPAITAPIPGLACPEEVDNMALAIKELRKELTAKETAEIRKLGEETLASLPAEYDWLRKWEYV